jgi:ABC-2 type transport system permease protein
VIVLRGLWALTWLEIKIFMREPLGVFAMLAMPALLSVVLGRVGRGRAGSRSRRPTWRC